MCLVLVWGYGLRSSFVWHRPVLTSRHFAADLRECLCVCVCVCVCVNKAWCDLEKSGVLAERRCCAFCVNIVPSHTLYAPAAAGAAGGALARSPAILSSLA